MVNIKFIIDDHMRYEYLDESCILHKFFLQHKKIKRRVLYKLNIYMKRRGVYYLSSLFNLYIYIFDKQVVILEEHKKIKKLQGIDISIKDHRKYKITLHKVDGFIYHFYLTDNKKLEKEYFYILYRPVSYRTFLPALLKKVKFRYHIDYIQRSFDQHGFYTIHILLTQWPKPWYIRLYRYFKYKFKN